MTFWSEVLAIFLGDVFASMVFVTAYAVIKWFLRATDVKIGYNWKWKDKDFHPSFDIRNRSSSMTYLLGNIAYTRNLGKDIVYFDNKSIWGKKLEPGSISFLDDVAPVSAVTSLPQCIDMEVSVRLQNGRRFWLKGQGPDQLRVSHIQRIAFLLRDKIEGAAIQLD